MWNAIINQFKHLRVIHLLLKRNESIVAIENNYEIEHVDVDRSIV